MSRVVFIITVIMVRAARNYFFATGKDIYGIRRPVAWVEAAKREAGINESNNFRARGDK